MRLSFMIAAVLILAPAAAIAQLYEYTDRNGNTVYTDHPSQGAESRQKSLNEDRVYRSGRREEPAAVPDKAALQEGRQPGEQPKKNYHRVYVVMYMTDW